MHTPYPPRPVRAPPGSPHSPRTRRRLLCPFSYLYHGKSVTALTPIQPIQQSFKSIYPKTLVCAQLSKVGFVATKFRKDHPSNLFTTIPYPIDCSQLASLVCFPVAHSIRYRLTRFKVQELTKEEEEKVKMALRQVELGVARNPSSFRNAEHVYGVMKDSVGSTRECAAIAVWAGNNWDTVVRGFQYGVNWILDQIKSAWGVIKSWVRDFWEWLKDFIFEFIGL